MDQHQGSMWLYNVTRETLDLLVGNFLKYSKNKVLLIKIIQINMLILNPNL